MEVMIAAVLIGLMLALLAGGVWIGLALMAIGILGMLGFTPRAPPATRWPSPSGVRPHRGP